MKKAWPCFSNNDKRVLITGASGFIGKALCCHLSKQGYDVLGTVRSVEKQQAMSKDGVNTVVVEDINSDTDWADVLSGVGVVIHTAARVHVPNDRGDNLRELYLQKNSYATTNLYEQSSLAGVTKFIFLSTVNLFVNDKSYEKNTHHICNDSLPNPSEFYGVSKLHAEKSISLLAKTHVPKVVILRLPLVYGWINRGNFPSLLKLVKMQLPLPFGLLRAKRSFLYIGNLCSAMCEIIQDDSIEGKAYFITDNNDVSLKGFIKLMAKHFDKLCFLLPIPIFVLKILGVLTGKTKLISRLTCSITVDSSTLRKDLNWSPPYTVDSALAEMAEQEKQNKKP